MVCGLPSSDKVKSFLARLRTILPCLSRTVARTFTTLTSVANVVSGAAIIERAAASMEEKARNISRRETDSPQSFGSIVINNDVRGRLGVTAAEPVNCEKFG